MRFALLLILAIAAGPLQSETYIAGYVGAAWTRSANVVLERFDPNARFTFESVPFRGRSFDSPVYYGYRAGHYFTKQFGVEAELVHLKVYADLDRNVSLHEATAGVVVRRQTSMREFADQFEVSHGLNLLLINAVFRRVFSRADREHARMVLVVRGGAGPTIPRPELMIFGQSGGAYELGPIAAQAAAGSELKLWRGVHALVEYKYTFTPTAFTIPSGHARFHVHSHHLVTGLAVHF